jgi:hypothetical protein
MLTTSLIIQHITIITPLHLLQLNRRCPTFQLPTSICILALSKPLLRTIPITISRFTTMHTNSILIPSLITNPMYTTIRTDSTTFTPNLVARPISGITSLSTTTHSSLTLIVQ